MIKPSVSWIRTNLHDPKNVQATEVRLHSVYKSIIQADTSEHLPTPANKESKAAETVPYIFIAASACCRVKPISWNNKQY